MIYRKEILRTMERNTVQTIFFCFFPLFPIFLKWKKRMSVEFGEFIQKEADCCSKLRSYVLETGRLRGITIWQIHITYTKYYNYLRCHLNGRDPGHAIGNKLLGNFKEKLCCRCKVKGGAIAGCLQIEFNLFARGDREWISNPSI